eukprot:11475715-Heterocapsa_arctica.AAC.1
MMMMMITPYALANKFTRMRILRQDFELLCSFGECVWDREKNLPRGRRQKMVVLVVVVVVVAVVVVVVVV